MKRFYKTAEHGTAPGGFVVRLDGKAVRTPMGNAMILSSAVLAEAMAEEWAAQGSEVIAAQMPINQLVNTMIDKSKGEDRVETEQRLCAFGASDLLCYFADHPGELVRRQKELWDPLLAWCAKDLGVKLVPVSGIQYAHQPDSALEALRRVIAGADPASFTAIQFIAGVTGSIVIALAFVHGVTDADGAYRATCVDEEYQMETWGRDALAEKRLDVIRADLEAAARFLMLVKSSG